MGTRLKWIALALAALATGALAAGCGGGAARLSVPEEAAQAAVARTLSETARRVAVSKIGATVCRQMVVGISERDWVRGTVVEIDSSKIRLRIDAPGRFAQTLNGARLMPGLVVWDEAAEWTPCY